MGERRVCSVYTARHWSKSFDNSSWCTSERSIFGSGCVQDGLTTLVHWKDSTYWCMLADDLCFSIFVNWKGTIATIATMTIATLNKEQTCEAIKYPPLPPHWHHHTPGFFKGQSASYLRSVTWFAIGQKKSCLKDIDNTYFGKNCFSSKVPSKLT